MSKILGIFTCHNRKEKTVKCLESLIHNNPHINFSFIAVDDKSTDGTKNALSQYKNMQIISGNGQCYYSGGMRIGIKHAKKHCEKYDWILLFNDDVVFFPNAIEKLETYSIMMRDEIITGAVCDEQGKLSYGGILKTSRFKPSFQIVMSLETRISCDTFNANCVLIPVRVFKSLPNIDRCYTHSMGDFDYGMEAKKRKVSITVSDFFVGICSDNLLDGTWRDVRLSRWERLQKKEQPKGLPCREWFHFVKKHYGPLCACISSITPYIKILFKKA